MAKQSNSTLLNVLAWFTGVVVSLVVGNAMARGALLIPVWLGGETPVGMTIAIAIGWVVMVTTLVSVVLAILKQ